MIIPYEITVVIDLFVMVPDKYSPIKPDNCPANIQPTTIPSIENIAFINALFNSVMDNYEWADQIIETHLQNWEFNRVAKVDKVLLRMGICEIYFLDDIPPKVSISEMVEISKVYSTDESPVFINGILDTVYKDFQKKGKT